MQRHRRNSSRENDKLEEINLRALNSDSESQRHGSSSWFPVPRRAMRSFRRWVWFILLVVVFLLLWQELDPNDSSPTLARYTHRAKARAQKLRGVNKKPKKSYTRQDIAELHVSWPGWDGIRNIFSFGDSHSETGFDPDGPQPDETNPIGNPAYPGRTAAYGPNYLSHLTATHNESFIKLHNMARGGLYHQDRVLDDGQGHRIPVWNQIEDVFLPRYGRSSGSGGKFSSGSGWKQDDSLFIFYDYTDELMETFMLRNGEPRNTTRVIADMIQYEENLKRIYDYGARNFLIINMPAMEECFTLRNAPIKRTLTTFGAEGVDTNARLAFHIQHFARKHPDATVFFYDVHRVSIRSRIDPTFYPETAGIKRKEGYCYFYADKKDVVEDDDACQNPLREFYWRDETHHTEPFHRLMARHAVELMSDLKNAFPLEVP